MKELVAGNYFVKKESVLLYIVIEGIGTFLSIAKAIILENPTTYSETNILFEFQSNPSLFTIVEEPSIWPKSEIKSKKSALEKAKETIISKTKEYTEEDIPKLDELFIAKIKQQALENGRVDTINTIVFELDIDKELAEVIYQKYA